MAKKLKQEYPSCYIQTHLSENQDEIKWVKELFPEAKSYLDVYDSFDLVSKRSIFGHAIYLTQKEYSTLHIRGASVSLCPTSNLFLGSGLFQFRKFKQDGQKVHIGFGSDIGAGTSVSMIKTLCEAYKVVSLEQGSALKREPLQAFEAFYQITLGAALSLDLDNKIGKLEEGYEADFVVLDLKPDPVQDLRISKIKGESIEALEEKLFAFMILGDDRNIKATYINGEVVYEKN